MTRSIFYRVRSPQGQWIRAANPLPFTISDLEPETVYEIDTGDGQIVERATRKAASAPGQVTGLTAQAGAGLVDLAWTAPADGGASIVDYRIEVDDGGGMKPVEKPKSTATSFRHTGLSAGVPHVYQVSAINAVSTGPASALVTAVPTAALANLLRNGDFSSGATGWSLGAGWSISGGVAERSAQPVMTHLSQSFPFEAGATYRISFEVLSLSGISVRAGLNYGGPFSANMHEAGLFQAELTARESNTSLQITPNQGAAVRLRNVVMVRL